MKQRWRGSKIGVLVFPLNDEAGYQQPLYREVSALGVKVQYLGTGTRSHTLNLLLLPFSLARHRLEGFGIWHIHWTYAFSTTWARRLPFGLQAIQLWYTVCLTIARILGYKIVWTAHNILPHEPIFRDDVAARTQLTHVADAVIAHQDVAVPKLESLGARNIHIIPAGSYTGEYKSGISRHEARQRLGLGLEDRVVVFLGNILPYKQVDWLLKAANQLSDEDLHLRVVVAGECRDSEMLAVLRRLAAEAGPRVVARFGHVPDDEIQVYFASADAAALPFSRITSSSSAILAMSFGVPLLLPDLPELAYFPDSVAIRYAPRFEALVDALAQVSAVDAEVLSRLSDGARRYVESLSWEQSGRDTVALYEELLNGASNNPHVD